MWALPDRPWVLHTAWRRGDGLTDGWIERQSAPGERYDSRLLALEGHHDHEPSPTTLVAGERPGVWLAYRLSAATRGLSSAWLARAFRRRPPAVLHAHYGHRASCLIPLARRVGVPLVASFYGDDASHERFVGSGRWARAYARLFGFASAVLAEGPAMADRLEGLGCPREKIRVVRIAAGAEVLDRLETRRGDDFVVALAGRFTEKKGFDVGIRAFARALGGRSDARLVVVGGGEQEEELRRIAAEEGLDGQVSWAGRLPFERFMSTVATSHVALYPSRSGRFGDSEGGAPVTLAEAQWLGVPAIVSAHDDLPFAAAPDGSVVVPPEDVGAWVDALRGVYEDRRRLADMCAASRAFAREAHSPDATIRAREAVYDEVSR